MMTPEEYSFIKNISKLYPNGDIIVAGTYNGGDVRSFYKGDEKRNIVVIDSFEGLAEPTKPDMAEDYMEQGECNIGGLEKYLKTFEGTDFSPPTEIYKMWIDANSLKSIKERKVSILFLDLDHYQPTKDCLEYFFSWIKEDGIVVVHDYDFVRCPGIKTCCDDFKPGWRKIKGTGFGILKVK